VSSLRAIFSSAFSAGATHRLSLRDRLRQVEDTARDAVGGWWTRQTSTPARKRRLGICGGVLVLLLGGGAWMIWGPHFQPDYDTAAMDDIFDYTLLRDEFNNLPVEKRLELLGKLVQRMRGMDANDSVLLAAFAAGIGGQARKQLEENASRLAIDLWDKHAKDYEKMPLEKREKFLDDAAVDFIKTMETIAGEPRDISDEQRLKELKDQAKRDTDWAKKNPDRMPDGKAMGRMAAVMNNNVGSHATPVQRARGAQMMRDMMRHFRGQDISTGKPKDPGPG
jgi:hypothetical protein